MALSVVEASLVSPLGLSPSEHVFFHRAEVAPHTSGAFTNREGEALPIHDCPWIPAVRPWASRIRLLAKQALARLGPIPPKTPILLVAPTGAMDGEADLRRFLTMSGQSIVGVRSGSSAYVSALGEAQDLLGRDGSGEHAVVLAVDSLVSQAEIEAWYRVRYSGFTRNPLPPSEGAAALLVARVARKGLAGKVHAFASGQSDVTDENDLPANGDALTRVLGELGLPAAVPLIVGPRDVDPLRTRDFHIAAARHHAKIDRAEMPSFEGRLGRLGSAAGLMSAVFALAWLRHGLPVADGSSKRVAVAWAQSTDGTVGAASLGDEAS